MGTWGPGIFDNDKAADWALGVAESTDISLVEATIEKALEESNEYLNASIAMEALAAIEVVARLAGNWGERNEHTSPADKWVEANTFEISDSLLDNCKIAIDRIIGSNSELNDNWQGQKDYYAQWKQAVIDLKKRIPS